MAGIHQLLMAAKGGSGVSVSITNQNISHSTFDPEPASATYAINSDGTVTDHDGFPVETWLVSGSNTGADVRATLSSGATPTGSALNTWINMATGSAWTLSQGFVGTTSCSLLVELRDASSLVVLDSATITITAEVA